jgi:hypothetical protein
MMEFEFGLYLFSLFSCVVGFILGIRRLFLLRNKGRNFIFVKLILIIEILISIDIINISLVYFDLYSSLIIDLKFRLLDLYILLLLIMNNLYQNYLYNSKNKRTMYIVYFFTGLALITTFILKTHENYEFI